MSETSHGMRILMTADTVGGVWDYSLELARHLAGQNIHTVLATMGALPSPAQRQTAAAIDGLLLQESEFRLEWMPGTSAEELARAGEWLLDLEDRLRPDLIHLNGYAHASLPWRAPCLIVAHSCVLSWWLAVKGDAAPSSWDAYAQRVRRGLLSAAAVVAPTSALLKALNGIYGSLPNSRVIWNGRDPARYRPGDKGRFIFCAGRLWDEAKNLAALAAAGADISWPVIAAGDWCRPDGKGPPRLNLQCLGILSAAEITDWLSRAPIYAMPAKYEPFGLAVLEAALSGCALVLGDIPTLRELWDGAALFVPPDDRRRLAFTLETLIRDESLRLALGQAARERALAYSGERMASAYLWLYQDLRRQEGRTAVRKSIAPASLAGKI